MTIDMNDDHLTSVTQLAELVKLGECVKFNSRGKQETYDWVNLTLRRFKYFSESKKNRGVIKNHIVTLTGYSDSQIDKLIRRKKKYGRIFLAKRTQNTFPKKYEADQVALLADVTSMLNHPNGKAVKQMMDDMYHIYEDNRFERLKNISVSHF